MMKVTKFAGPRWNQQRSDERKADVTTAKDQHGTGNSVPELRVRIDRLERILGVS